MTETGQSFRDDAAPAAVLLLHFGEPETPDEDAVLRYLERIFLANARLEGAVAPEAARARSRELARRRAPALLEEYRAIGGSPHDRQAHAQAAALAAELARRGRAVRTYTGMQFTDPGIAEAVRAARDDGARRLVALPLYPLCGPSTTLAALDELDRQIRALGWEVERHAITGWHRHPLYTRIRADGVRETAARAGLDLRDPAVRLVFSAHGTPLRYIEEGSRYVEYVEESCRAIAREAGAPDYAIGYQNHGSRPVEWTAPPIEEVIDRLEARHAVVVPVSFMHEQSETLAELDLELRERAEARGLGFHRVPVPHDDPRFIRLLADLVEPLLDGGAARALAPCRCRPGARCAPAA